MRMKAIRGLTALLHLKVCQLWKDHFYNSDGTGLWGSPTSVYDMFRAHYYGAVANYEAGNTTEAMKRLGMAFITVVAGIYNFKFIGGTLDAKPINVALSIVTYTAWTVTSVQMIRSSINPVYSCFKISVALAICCAIGSLLFSPLTAVFVSPIIGICMLLTDDLNLFFMAVLLYGGIIMLDWLCVALIMCRRRRHC